MRETKTRIRERDKEKRTKRLGNIQAHEQASKQASTHGHQDPKHFVNSQHKSRLKPREC